MLCIFCCHLPKHFFSSNMHHHGGFIIRVVSTTRSCCISISNNNSCFYEKMMTIRSTIFHWNNTNTTPIRRLFHHYFDVKMITTSSNKKKKYTDTIIRRLLYPMTVQRRYVKLSSSVPFSSSSSSSSSFANLKSTLQKRSRSKQFLLFGSLLFVIGMGSSSIYVRQYRSNMMQTLPYANRYLDDEELMNIIQIVERVGLMGKCSSVKEELEDIRRWHIQNGYKGGLVLRDVTQPIYGDDNDDNDDNITTSTTIGSISTTDNNNNNNITKVVDHTKHKKNNKINLNQRECYYLYYEMKSNGMIIQQIFCRGTTLLDDIITCFQFWMIYDNECQCYVHNGFRNHAQRILDDVIPLLMNSSRANVEVCGHSLGGAVASILAIKLRKLGYNVTRLTTVGEPRYVFRLNNNGKNKQKQMDSNHIINLLPKHHIRIEHEYDFVTYLPPFGSKIDSTTLYITSKHGIRYVGGALNDDHNNNVVRKDTNNNTSIRSFLFSPTSWTNESILWNFLLPEIIMTKGSKHRIPSYVNSLKTISKQNENKTEV